MASGPGASSISVAVRVRPFTIREAAQLQQTDSGTLFLGDGSLAGVPTPKLNQKGLRSVIKVVDDRCLVFDPPEDNPVQKFSRSVVPAAGKKVKDQVFAFDRIFDDNASQMDVYEGTTKGLLDSVLDGYNATVFAYGATGCGKTHTITGTAQQPGIIFMTMQELFEKIGERSAEKHTELTLSYLEIYNETIRDLLVPGGSKQGLMLREDTNQAVTVSGLTSHHPRDVQEVMDMIVRGNEYRTVSPTEANAVSSRSHAVLQINVAQRDRNASVNEPHTMATLSIIDLAGSERASATKNRGERLLEGANINKSLLALGGCINALCDPRKKNHVPYRNSKLTRLLKFSLGGNCKTVMIVCVSPSSAHFDETQNTLRYANRAKNIQTKVTRNVFNVNRHVKDFLVKIDEQMAMITELKAAQKDAETRFGLKVRRQLDKRDSTAREGIQRLRQAYEHALPDRQRKVSDMKKLRAIERRLVVLTAWADSFDMAQEAVAHTTEARGALPDALETMRKTARGIAAELEHSRHHLHSKIERSNWERPLDSALQHSTTQLTAVAADSVAADVSEAIASLQRETQLLKANFAREAYLEVLEQDKTHGAQGDMAMMQTLLSTQFEIVSALTHMLAMPRDDAVAHGQRLVRRLVESAVAAASQLVKPDPSFGASASLSASFSSSLTAGADMYSPSKTPRRRVRDSVGGGRTSTGPTGPTLNPHLLAAAKASPRRRKMGSLGARPRVSFGAKKKFSTASSVSSRDSLSSLKRSVRWRDDETEEGTLADFEKTPQKAAVEPEDKKEDKTDEKDEKTWTMETVPEESPSPKKPALPSYMSRTDLLDTTDDEDSSLNAPELSVLPGASTVGTSAKPSRFNAGFLAKTRPSVGPSGSGHSGNSSDSSAKKSTPLRNISVPRAANQLSPPSATRIASLSRSYSSSGSPKAFSPKASMMSTTTAAAAATTTDENALPPTRLRSPSPRLSLNGSSSDKEKDRKEDHKEKGEKDRKKDTPLTLDDLTSGIDSQKLRSALHSAKKASAAQVPHAVSANARRVSTAYLGTTLASSTSGISRQRRKSAERRRSPPMACSSAGSGSGAGSGTGVGGAPSSMTPGQARRMNMGGSLRWDSSSGSPHGRSVRGRDALVGAMEPPSSGGSASSAITGKPVRRVTIGTAAMGGPGATGATGAPMGGSARKERPVVWR